MSLLTFSSSFPRPTRRPRTRLRLCAISRSAEPRQAFSNLPQNPEDGITSENAKAVSSSGDLILPKGFRRKPLSSEAARSLVERNVAILSALRRHPGQFVEARSESPNIADNPQLLRSEAADFLRGIVPWSERAAQQRDMLLESLHASATLLPRQGLYIFCLRALKYALSAAADADQMAVVATGVQDKREARETMKKAMRSLSKTSAQYARVRMVGSTPNVHWRCVDRDMLRAHVSWQNLPLPGSFSILEPRDLRYLRQDCEAWFGARSLIQVNASTAWMALGFGEQRAARRLGITKSSGMRSHDHALQAFEQMTDPQPYSAKRRVRDEKDIMQQVYRRFGSLHEAGALLAYIAWENGVYSDTARRSREEVNGVQPGSKFNEMVRVQEAGLYVLQKESIPAEYDIDYNDVPVIAASPDGIVRRRRGDEFGAWEISGTEVVEVKCRVPFIPLSDQKWMFRLLGPRQGVTASNYVQVQFQMLCGGPHVRRATIVSYAVLGGMTVIAVERDDAWLKSALKVLADFYAEYVWTGRTPEHDFFADRPDYEAFVQLTRDLMRKVELVAEVPPEESELALLPKNAEERRQFSRWRADVFMKTVSGNQD